MLQYWYSESGATHNINSDAWTAGAGANKNVAVQIGGGRDGPVTHDDDTSYNVSSGSGQLQDVNIDWPGPVSALVSGYTFTASFRHRATQNSPRRALRFVDDSGTQGGAIYDITNGTTSYVSEAEKDVSAGATYSPTGAAWTPAQFNQTSGWLNVQTEHLVPTTTVRVTSVWGQLEFSPPAGLFLFPLSILAGLPFLGRLTDFGQFMAYLDWHRLYHPRHTILRPWELPVAWSDVKAWRWPHTVVLAS